MTKQSLTKSAKTKQKTKVSKHQKRKENSKAVSKKVIARPHKPLKSLGKNQKQQKKKDTKKEEGEKEIKEQKKTNTPSESNNLIQSGRSSSIKKKSPSKKKGKSEKGDNIDVVKITTNSNLTSSTIKDFKKPSPSKSDSSLEGKRKKEIKAQIELPIKASQKQPKGKVGKKSIKSSPNTENVKEITPIETSSDQSLSAEQKKLSEKLKEKGSRTKQVQPSSGMAKTSEKYIDEIETAIEKVEKRKKKGSKMLAQKRKRGETSLVTSGHTAEDYNYILQHNPNIKKKGIVNLEIIGQNRLISYSDVLLSLLEVGHNPKSYNFAYSSKSKAFWSDILEYKLLKNIFVDFQPETLRKYWQELSKYDPETAADVIKKNKSYLDKVPVKLGTIVTSISKFLGNKISNLQDYIKNLQVDIRKREVFEHEFRDQVTGQIVKIKEVRTIVNTRKRYEPGTQKDFKGNQLNVVALQEVYHENSKLNPYQNIVEKYQQEQEKKDEYLTEITMENKKKLSTINEQDKFIFKTVDLVVEQFAKEFKYSPEFILETLMQNSMDISRTYTCLKEPMKAKIIGYTSLDDKIILEMNKGEEFKNLMKEKGAESIKERENYLNC